jgi:hypothetical protein
MSTPEEGKVVSVLFYHYDMKMYSGVEVYLHSFFLRSLVWILKASLNNRLKKKIHSFLASAVDGGEW